MMKLYGFGPTRSLRVLWALGEVGASFEFVPVNLRAGAHRSPEFLRINPAGKVPVLVDGDLVLNESAAIVLYLAEKYPEKGLIPGDPKLRADAYRWVLFAMTELEQPLWRIAKNSFLYPENRRQPSDVTLAREEFIDMAQVLDRHMQGREFVVGNRFSIADCVIAYLMDWGNEVGLLESLPNLRVYLDRMYERPTAPPRIAAARAQIPA